MLLARYENRSGLVLFLPADGRAPLLFLEFIKEQKRYFEIKTYTPTDSKDFEFICVRIQHASRETFSNAVDYINENLAV